MVAEIAYRRGGWGAHAVADDALLDLGPHLVDLRPLDHERRGHARAPGEVTPEPGRRSTWSSARRGPAIRCATDRLHHERVEVRAPRRHA